MGEWRVVVRRRGGVEKGRHPTLAEALAMLEARLDELAAGAPRGDERSLGRTVPAAEVVAARGELRRRGRGSGRRAPAGVDLHADRTTTPWTGRLQRRPVELLPGETAYEALARVLGP
jgi:hypothetical protein